MGNIKSVEGYKEEQKRVLEAQKQSYKEFKNTMHDLLTSWQMVNNINNKGTNKDLNGNREGVTKKESGA